MKEKPRRDKIKAALPPSGRSLPALAVLIVVVAVFNIGFSTHFLVHQQDRQWMSQATKSLFMSSMQRVTSDETVSSDEKDVSSSSGSPLNPQPTSTLALLYPPGLLGGYRNQVIRFIGLCLYAQQHNITQLYEPSLLWSTQLHGIGTLYEPSLLWSTQLQGIGTSVPWWPIPMAWIFDVAHWNDVAATEGLPRIVQHLHNPDCWQEGLFDNYNTSDWGPLPRTAFLQSGSLTGVTNETYRHITNDPTFKARRTDLLPKLSHCQRPIVYGGGKMGGRLWNDMMKRREAKKKPHPADHTLDRAILRALQPAPRWRQLAASCLAQNHNDTTSNNYVALHARVELEMLSHACGKTMEHNLTNILQQAHALVESKRQHDSAYQTLDSLFIAVSRTGMQYTNEYNAKLREIADYNVNVLNKFTKATNASVKLANELTVFECGERLVGEFYQQNPNAPDHGSLLQSVVNFIFADRLRQHASSAVLKGKLGLAGAADLIKQTGGLG